MFVDWETEIQSWEIELEESPPRHGPPQSITWPVQADRPDEPSGLSENPRPVARVRSRMMDDLQLHLCTTHKEGGASSTTQEGKAAPQKRRVGQQHHPKQHCPKERGRNTSQSNTWNVQGLSSEFQVPSRSLNHVLVSTKTVICLCIFSAF